MKAAKEIKTEAMLQTEGRTTNQLPEDNSITHHVASGKLRYTREKGNAHCLGIIMGVVLTSQSP